MKGNYNLLFTPGKINKLELKNRVLMAPMHTGYSPDGHFTEQDYAYYERRAKGGAAVISVVAKINSLAGLANMHSIESDEYIADIEKMAEIAHANGSKLMVQLFHCGRNGNEDTLNGAHPVGAFNVPSPYYRDEVHQLTKDEIKAVQNDYAEAAKRCVKAGVDIIEVSAASGYLLCQFFSPHTNLRSDEYGGCTENRMRFGLETLRAVREAVGADYPLSLRFSPSSMCPGGYELADGQAFAAAIDSEKLVDLFNVTHGWNEAPAPLSTYHVNPAAYAHFADAVKRVVKHAQVSFAGRVNSGDIAETILEKGITDFVTIGRGLMADPEMVNKIQNGKSYYVCQSCNKCVDKVMQSLQVDCTVNPEMNREYLLNALPPIPKKRILVVGGGPAGIYAAINTARRGADVTLVTNEDRLGGQMNLAAVPPRKQDYALCGKNAVDSFRELGIKTVYNTTVDINYIKEFAPDYVFVATGNKPLIPPIPGIDGEQVFLAVDLLKGGCPEKMARVKKGPIAVIGGGAIGLESTLWLAHSAFSTDSTIDFMREFLDSDKLPKQEIQPRITVIEMLKKCGNGMGSERWIMLKALKERGVELMANTKVKEILPGIIIAEDIEGNEVKILADSVVLSMGSRPNDCGLGAELEAAGIPFSKVGDALKVGTAHTGMKSSWEVCASKEFNELMTR